MSSSVNAEHYESAELRLPGNPVMSGRHTVGCSARADTRRGVLCVSAAAVLYAFIPVSLDLLIVDGSPLVIGFGAVVGYVLVFVVDRRRLVRRISRDAASRRSAMTSAAGTGPVCSDTEERLPLRTTLSVRGLLRLTRSAGLGWSLIVVPLGCVCVAGASYAIFAWSASLIDTAVTSAMYEVWPMLWFLAAQHIDRVTLGPCRTASVPFRSYAVMFLGVPATALIVFSSGVSVSGMPFTGSHAAGLMLAFAAPVAGTAGIASNYASRRLVYESYAFQREHRKQRPIWNDVLAAPSASVSARTVPAGTDRTLPHRELDALEEAISHSYHIAARILLLPVLLTVTALKESSLTWLASGPLLGGFLIGAFLNGLGSIFLLRTHYVTERRDILALQYLSPVLSLLLLAAVTGIDIPHIGLLTLGASIIVAANILICLDPKTKTSHDVAADTAGEPCGTEPKHESEDCGRQDGTRPVSVSIPAMPSREKHVP